VGADLGDREKILGTLGSQCHIMAAQRLEDALAHVNDAVALVICEIKSADVNGLELMQKWKQQRSATPFLMLAEGRDVAAVVEAMKLGADDCIVKPVNALELRAAATELLKKSRGGSQPGDRFTRRRPQIDIPPDTSLEDLERAAVEQALLQHQGNRTHAARTLGISVRTLQRKLKAWGMPILSFSNSAAGRNYVMAAHTAPAPAYGAHAL